jgi:hypothetical protein
MSMVYTMVCVPASFSMLSAMSLGEPRSRLQTHPPVLQSPCSADKRMLGERREGVGGVLSLLVQQFGPLARRHKDVYQRSHIVGQNRVRNCTARLNRAVLDELAIRIRDDSACQ